MKCACWETFLEFFQLVMGSLLSSICSPSCHYLSRKGKKLAVTISPLNALIRDQVSNLNARGVKAGVLQASHQVIEDDNQRLLWAAHGWMFPLASVSKEVFIPNLNKKMSLTGRRNKKINIFWYRFWCPNMVTYWHNLFEVVNSFSSKIVLW